MPLRTAERPRRAGENGGDCLPVKGGHLELLGAHARVLFESAAEVGEVVVAHLAAHLLHGHVV